MLLVLDLVVGTGIDRMLFPEFWESSCCAPSMEKKLFLSTAERVLLEGPVQEKSTP